jgi:hypothetical protein
MGENATERIAETIATTAERRQNRPGQYGGMADFRGAEPPRMQRTVANDYRHSISLLDAAALF